jgi:hypothetical protein
MLNLQVDLPVLHSGQVTAYHALRKTKRGVARCGRRFGKTVLLETMAADPAAKGWPVGIFAPDYKILSETYHDLASILAPILVQSSRVDGVMRTMTGGRIDFWSLDNDRAGRSRKYKRVLCDEVAFTKPNMMGIWQKSIEPTLLDLAGDAYFFSNTNGVDTENFLWRLCNNPDLGFTDYNAPTHANPHLPKTELDRIKAETHPLVYRQEYLAEFVDFSGDAFFSQDWMLEQGQPVDPGAKCDAVFAVIDTALKDGKEHDGTAVSFYAVNKYYGAPIILLDWDILSIEGSLLENWLPSVYQRLETFAQQYQARNGSLGAFIEDRGSGTILLQQAYRRNWLAKALPEAMVAAGKAGRAVSVSGYIYQGKLKISRDAFEKVTTYKGATRNHWLAQVTGFRIGAKDGAADDLLDTMTYGVAIVCGDWKGN